MILVSIYFSSFKNILLSSVVITISEGSIYNGLLALERFKPMCFFTRN